jgi:hypothetical protein
MSRVSFSRRLFLTIALGLAAGRCDHAAADEGEVRFGRDVLPILSDRCFHCHGPDASHRKADLRLDEETGAKRDLGGGLFAIKPGDPAASEVWRRIITDEPDEVMPPPDSHRKPISESEREILRRWIAGGARWGRHWAFEKPIRPAVPAGNGHPVDALVKERLDAEGMAPSAPADPATLLRRLSFDLTGLPPSPAVVESFTRDPSAAAWASAVDRLLESPHHAERLAMWWLDAARYSETDGYQGDAERTNWPWRDWVVRAFQDNMPFDQFTIEQFAGDLLPGATPEQVLATAFHRHHMTNGEGGRDPEESRIDYVIDRVNTMGTVWLGLTLGCTQCHTHKFDPIEQRDYYRLFAFFDSIDEDGKAGTAAKPYLKYQSPLAARAVKEMETHLATLKPRVDAARAAAEVRFAAHLESSISAAVAGYRAWRPLSPASISSAEGTGFRLDEGTIVQAIGPNPRQDDYRVTMPAPMALPRVTGWRLEVLPHDSHTGGKLSRGASGEFILTNVKLLVRKKGQSQVREIEMAGAVADYEKEAKTRAYGKVKDTLDDDPRNGWTTEGSGASGPHVAVFELAEPYRPAPDEELTFVLLQRSTVGDANLGRFRISATDEAGETVRGLKPSPMEDLASSKPGAAPAVDPALRKRLLEQYLLDEADYQIELARYNEASRQLAEVRKAAGDLNVMVLAERPEPRRTHVLVRGVWDAKGEAVERGVLPSVLSWPDEKARTRLDLARWLVSADNPLTARVVANHLWQMLFGAGLVRTTEDFGVQGEMPTHPALLDWLAVELIESGWDLRHLLRVIATSETYRQSSDTTPALLERDPDNRLLARAPRYRLPAWMIRDHALAASGLLNPALGGPPVKPWQPEGVWEEIFMGRYTYQPSAGPAQYRRTLYAYWRRSSAPTFLFDSAQRRVCEVRQNRTNTPLHALTLMNDTTMLEASRALAGIAAAKPEAGLAVLSRRVLSRGLSAAETAVFERERQRALSHYREHPDEAVIFTTVGQQLPPPAGEAPDLAAWMTVASLMLNLDEAMTRE